MTTIPGATTFPSETPQKKFRFRARGHFLGLTPVFGRFFKKNDPEGQRTRSGPELRRNGRFYVRPKKLFLASKWVLPQKITQNEIFPLDYLGKGYFFSLN